MRREELVELHYITPIANVPSILARGLLSHRRIRKLKVKHVSVAMEEVQDRREGKIVPGGLPLHDYVNMYINGRNATLYRMQLKNPQETLCILRVDPDVLGLPDVVMTDRNAASWSRYSAGADGLEHIDKDVVFARYWNHSDEKEKAWHKAAMCAEVLVPERVDPRFIRGAYVPSEADRKALLGLAPDLPVEIRDYLFFR